MAIKSAQRLSSVDAHPQNCGTVFSSVCLCQTIKVNGGAQHWDLPARYRPADHVQRPDAISTLGKGSVATHKQSGGKGEGLGGPFIFQDLFLGLFEFKVIWVTEGKRISERGKGVLRDLVQVCDIGTYGYRFWYDYDKITCEGSWSSGTGWAPRIFRRYMPSVRGRLVISNKSYCKVVRNKLLNPQAYHPQCTKLS